MTRDPAPDVFQLPVPPGLSRESTIVLDAEGRFWHDGALVEHAGMAAAFARWIARHPDDGRYVLNNGVDFCYIKVQDVPFFVEQVKSEQGSPWIRLSDGTWEALNIDSLEVASSQALYVSVKGRKFRARFRQSAQLALEPWLDVSNGELSLRVGSTLRPIKGANSTDPGGPRSSKRTT